MRKIFTHRFFFPLLLTLLVALIAYLNYTPGTFLTGWDTLHPELNFSLNFQRLLDGVWREEQGLGAVAGHSHMADLPRLVVLWILHFVAPLNMLRYLYVFLCLLMGPLGVFYLIKFLFFSHSGKPQAHPESDSGQARMTDWIPFLASLFYLFNLSTVQQFFAPFEMFPTQYAALPWIMLFTLQYLQTHSKRALLKLAFVTLLATPQAYAAHLWYPFFGVYVMFLMLYAWLHKRKNESGQNQSRSILIKKSLVLIFVTISVNSFWLFPNVYFIVTSSSVPKESKQNRLFSQEYRLRNRENGYLGDVTLMKGFYFNWSVYNFKTSTFQFLMPAWRDHAQNPFILTIGYFLFINVLLGIYLALRRRSAVLVAFLPFVIVPFVFLMNHTPPFEQFFDFLLRFSLFEEALRFVFSKFSILILFGYTVYLSYFFLMLFDYIHSRASRALLQAVCFAVYVACFVTLAFPMFQGQLIGRSFRIKIPQEYFSFWQYMQTQDSSPVLTLPLYNFAGWEYYKWGYQGAGFLWFNMPQPVLTRDFDRWSIANEQSYREHQYALYAQQPLLFEKALNKFHIGYVVWDHNVISPSLKNRKQITYERETQELISTLIERRVVDPPMTFGAISVYRVHSTHQKPEVFQTSINLTPSYRWNTNDSGYEQFGPYITTTSNPNVNRVSYPYRNLTLYTDRVFPGKLRIEPRFKTYYLTSDIKPNGLLQVPTIADLESTLFTRIYVQATTSPTQFVVRFEPMLPTGLVKPFDQKVAIDTKSTEQALSFTVNDTRIKVQKADMVGRAWAYAGEAFIYTKQTNFIVGIPFKPVFAQLAEGYLPTDLPIQYPSAAITYPANKIVISTNDRASITIRNGLSDPTAHFDTTQGQNGAYLPMETLPHNVGYAVIVKARNLQGLPLRICIRNLYADVCTLYDELSHSKDFTEDYFILPPMEAGIGYSISLDNLALGNISSINDVKTVTVIPIAYNLISHLYYDSTSTQSPKPQSVLTNYQTYHEGWQAYNTPTYTSRFFPALLGTRLTKHVLVNNWANGWILEPGQSLADITFVYTPQYLEYAGFALLIATLLAITFSAKKQQK